MGNGFSTVALLLELYLCTYNPTAVRLHMISFFRATFRGTTKMFTGPILMIRCFKERFQPYNAIILYSFSKRFSFNNVKQDF